MEDKQRDSLMAVTSFLLPVVGLIYGAVMLTSDNHANRAAGQSALTMSMFSLLIWLLATFLFGNVTVAI